MSVLALSEFEMSANYGPSVYYALGEGVVSEKCGVSKLYSYPPNK